MKKIIGFILIFSVMVCSSNLTAEKDLTAQDLADIEEVALTFKEAGYYFGASMPFYAALGAFNQKNGKNPAEITCKFCPKRSLPCSELIVKVQAKAIGKAKKAKDCIANETRKKMLATYDEITKLLCLGSIDDVRKFMANVAQEEEIPCEGCKKVEWKAEGISKNKK